MNKTLKYLIIGSLIFPLIVGLILNFTSSKDEKVKIINIGSTNRHFNEQFAIELAKYLPTEKNKTISIFINLGDQEANIFATEIEDYLESNGWKVDGGVSQVRGGRPRIGIQISKEGTEIFIGVKPETVESYYIINKTSQKSFIH